MPVKKFYGAKFDYNHEVEQYREVRNLIEELYGDRTETVYLLFNVQLESQIDLIILKNDLIVLLELKSLGGKINGSENGDWSVTTDSGEKEIGDLYRQAKSQKWALHNALKDIIGKEIYNIQGWGYFKNGSSYDKSQIISKNQFKWFDIVWKDTLTPKLVGVEKSGFELAEGDIGMFINSLNLDSADFLELEENFRFAGEAYVKDNFVLVLEHADKALKIDQENVRAWNYRCIGLMGLEEFNKAEEANDNALYFDGTYAPAVFNKGVIQFENQNYEGALEIFKEFIDRCKELSYKPDRYDGKEFFLAENKKELKELGLKKAEAIAWEYMGDCLFESAEDLMDWGLLEEAIKYYDRALELEPYSTDLSQKKCRASYYDCDDKQALDCIEVILEIDPNNFSAWYNKGILLAADEMKEAINCFNEFLNNVEDKLKGNVTVEGKSFFGNKSEIHLDRTFNDIISDAWYQKGGIHRDIIPFLLIILLIAYANDFWR